MLRNKKFNILGYSRRPDDDPDLNKRMYDLKLMLSNLQWLLIRFLNIIPQFLQLKQITEKIS